MGNTCMNLRPNRSQTNEVSIEAGAEARSVVLGANKKFITVLDYEAGTSAIPSSIVSGAGMRTEHRTVKIVPSKAAKILFGMRIKTTSTNTEAISRRRVRYHHDDNTLTAATLPSLQQMKRGDQTRKLSMNGPSQDKDEVFFGKSKLNSSVEADKSETTGNNYEQLKKRYRQRYEQLNDSQDNQDLSGLMQPESKCVVRTDGKNEEKSIQFHVNDHAFLQLTKSDPFPLRQTWQSVASNNRYSRFNIVESFPPRQQQNIAAAQQSTCVRFRPLPPIPTSKRSRSLHKSVALPEVNM